MDQKCNNEDYYNRTTVTTITTTTTTTNDDDRHFEELLKEIKSNRHLSKEILCPTYKKRIIEHCLKVFDQYSIGPYDLEKVENFIGDDMMMLKICHAFNYYYMKCLVTFLNGICLPKEFANFHKENIGIKTMCKSFYYQLILITKETERQKWD